MNRFIREPHLRMPEPDPADKNQQQKEGRRTSQQSPQPPYHYDPRYQEGPSYQPQRPFREQNYQNQQPQPPQYSYDQPPYDQAGYNQPPYNNSWGQQAHQYAPQHPGQHSEHYPDQQSQHHVGPHAGYNQQPPYQQRPVTAQHLMQQGEPKLPVQSYDQDLDDPEPHAPRPSLWRVLIAIFGLVSIAGMSWLAYHWSMQNDGPPPVIPSPEGPYKIKPDSPGGAVIDYKDTLIYDRLANNPSHQTREADVVIMPSEPEVAPAHVGGEPQQPMQHHGSLTQTPLAHMNSGQAVYEPMPLQQPQEPVTIPESSVAPVEDVNQAQNDMNNMLTKLDEIQEVSTPQPMYFLQMATLQSEEQALAEMNRLKGRLRLQSSKWHMRKADTSNGKQYVLLIGPYKTKMEAQDRCASIKHNCTIIAAE